MCVDLLETREKKNVSVEPPVRTEAVTEPSSSPGEGFKEHEGDLQTSLIVWGMKPFISPTSDRHHSTSSRFVEEV